MDLNGNNTILPELDKMINETMKIMQIFKIHSKRRVETMAIFDQVDSTGSKMKLGHDEATQKIFHHNIICRQIVKKMNGTVIKDTGDGVLTRFLDPMNACLCAINIQHAINKADIVTRGALSMGMVEEAHFTDYVDLYGTAVDLCSRIEKCALPNQILIDKTLYDSINTFLRDHDDIHVSEPMSVELKGLGNHSLYEISYKDYPLKNKLNSF